MRVPLSSYPFPSQMKIVLNNTALIILWNNTLENTSCIVLFFFNSSSLNCSLLTAKYHCISYLYVQDRCPYGTQQKALFSHSDFVTCLLRL